MTDLAAYRICHAVAIRRRVFLTRAGIELADAAHELYVRWRTRDNQDGERMQVARMFFDVLQLAREKFGRRDRKPRPKFLAFRTPDDYPAGMATRHSFECERAATVYDDQDAGLAIEEIRQVDEGRFAALVDAYLANDGEQKAAAASLGVTQPAVNQRLKTLRRRMAAA